MEQNKDYLNLTLTLVTFALLIAFAIRPSATAAVKLRKEVIEYDQINNKLKDKVSTIAEAGRKTNELNEYSMVLDNTIPATADEGSLLSILSTEALSNNLLLSDISYTYNTSSNPNSLSISMDLEGDFPDIKNFMKNITSKTRIIEINDIEMNLIKGQDSENLVETDIVRVTLEAKAYYNLQ